MGRRRALQKLQGLQLSGLRLRVEVMDPSALLRAQSIRPTPLRKEALSLLLAAGVPLSLKTLSDCFHGKQPDRVSLYRTLGLLEQKGIVHKVLGADSAWRYCAHSPEENGCPGNHAHFLCLECGRMICLQDQVIPLLDLPDEYVVDGKQLLAYGLCAECAKKSGRLKQASPPSEPGAAGGDLPPPKGRAKKAPAPTTPSTPTLL